MLTTFLSLYTPFWDSAVNGQRVVVVGSGLEKLEEAKITYLGKVTELLARENEWREKVKGSRERKEPV